MANQILLDRSKNNDKNAAIPYFQEKYPGKRAPIEWKLSQTKSEDYHGRDFMSIDYYPCWQSENSVEFTEEKITNYDSKYHIKSIVTLVIDKKLKVNGNYKDYEIITDIYFHVFKDCAFTISRKYAIDLAIDLVKKLDKKIVEKEENGYLKKCIYLDANDIMNYRKELCFNDCSDFISKFKDTLDGYNEFANFLK